MWKTGVSDAPNTKMVKYRSETLQRSSIIIEYAYGIQGQEESMLDEVLTKMHYLVTSLDELLSFSDAFSQCLRWRKMI
jgi:hypothetical protein